MNPNSNPSTKRINNTNQQNSTPENAKNPEQSVTPSDKHITRCKYCQSEPNWIFKEYPNWNKDNLELPHKLTWIDLITYSHIWYCCKCHSPNHSDSQECNLCTNYRSSCCFFRIPKDMYEDQ